MCSETKKEKVAKEGGLNEGLGWGLFNSSLSFDLLVIGWLPVKSCAPAHSGAGGLC